MDYGTKPWFENQFKNLDVKGDRWGHRWRGSQKFRYDLYTKILKSVLPTKKKIKILDIGCALGDFTKRVWQLDPKNEIFGIDISENAIDQVSKEYPTMKFRVGSLPVLSFNENSFDLVLCLEVLYYLNPVDRVKSLEYIKKVLKTDGYLFFSGVLDGGVRYFAEDEIIELISKYFDVERIEYNYAMIYTAIESKFLFLLNISEIIEMALNMSDTEFLKWCDDRRDKLRVEKVKKVRKIINRMPFGQDMTMMITRVVGKPIKATLSAKVFVILSYKLTKFLFSGKGKTSIIILCRRKP
jgi:2-polyprenyl-3-methyl-5-hydroxy-6-metoxy-1,4-benzoquinol methylase